MINHDFIVPKKSKSVSPLKKPHITMAIGQTGSGKSVAVFNYLNALQEEKEYDDALFVTSNKRDPLLKSLGKDVKLTNDPQDLNDFIIKVKQKPNPEKSKSIIILDDIQSSNDFNLMLGRSLFNNFILSHRHYHTDIIATSQTLKNSFSPIFRKNVTRFLIFYPRDEDEMKEIEGVSGNRLNMKKALALLKNDPNPNQFLNIYKYGAQRDYILGFNQEKLDL